MAAMDGIWGGRFDTASSSAELPARCDQTAAVVAKSKSRIGDTMMCLLPRSWWVSWKQHVEKAAAAPQRIDSREVTLHTRLSVNTTMPEYIGLSLDILEEDEWTRDGKMAAFQHERVTVVSVAVGMLLRSWYGGELAMHPRVRAEPGSITECPIDLRPLHVHVQYWLFTQRDPSGVLADGNGEQAEEDELIECSFLMQRHALVDQLRQCVLAELDCEGDSFAHDPLRKGVKTPFNADELDFRMWAADRVDPTNEEHAMLTLLINSELLDGVALDCVPALCDESAERVFVRMHGRYSNIRSWGTAIDRHDSEVASAPAGGYMGGGRHIGARLPTLAHSDTLRSGHAAAPHMSRLLPSLVSDRGDVRSAPRTPRGSAKRKMFGEDRGTLSTKTASGDEGSGGGGGGRHRDGGVASPHYAKRVRSSMGGSGAWRGGESGGATSSPRSSSYMDPGRSSYVDDYNPDEMYSCNVTRKGSSAGYEMPAEAAGIVGLRNLGNTCFLNSILQCLLHLRPLRRVFGVEGGGAWKDAINASNRDGTGGELAREFAKLMKAAWSGEYSCLKPVRFKNVLGRFVPHLAGFAQQDSQEALGAIIDKLQEDLNLCVSKPYIERPEGSGRSLEDDDRVAAEATAGHKKRNDSVIGDAVSGFYRNRMECCNASCSRVSVTFDPFNQLTLTLPSKHCMPRAFRATYVPADGSSPIEIAAVVSGDKSVAELLNSMRDAIRAEVRQSNAIRGEDHGGATTVYCEVDAPDYEDDDANSSGGAPLDEPHLKRARLVGVGGRSSSVGGELPHLVLTRERWTGDKEKNGIDIDRVFAPSTSVVRIKPTDTLLVYAVELPEEEADDGEKKEAALQSAPHISAAAAAAEGGGAGESQEGGSSSSSSSNNSNSTALAYVIVRQVIVMPNILQCIGRPVVVAYRPNITTYRSLRERIVRQLRGYMHQLGAFDAARQFTLYTRRNSFCASHKFDLDHPSSRWGVEGDNLCVAAPGKMPQYRHGTSVYDKKKNAAATYFDATLLWECPREMLDLRAMNAVRPTLALEAPKEGGDGGRKSGVDLQQLLERFSAREQLETDNTWYCSACKEHVRAHKQLTLWSTSEILIVHLKRFSHERSWLEKNEMMVRFPLSGLDLRPFRGPKSAVAALSGATGDAPGAGGGAAEGAAASGEDDGDDALYDLVGVSHHMGGMGGGHYVASVRADDGDWCVHLPWRSLSQP